MCAEQVILRVGEPVIREWANRVIRHVCAEQVILRVGERVIGAWAQSRVIGAWARRVSGALRRTLV